MNGLDEIKVLELGRVFSGPLCGMLLADIGARVLKVERPGVGDESRRFGVHRAGGESCYFNSLNRNKKSIALDLKREADRELFVDLVQKADVLVHNWIQASLDKLGFSWEEVSRLNPRIIYCQISGFGETSFASRPSQDVIAQALSGFMSLTGEQDGPPLKTAIPVVDYATGLYAAYSIASALYLRERTGRGQRTTVSLLETALAMTSFASSEFLSAGAVPKRTGNRHPSICPYNLYATRDGHVVIAIANDAMWRRFCRALALDQLAEDPRFAENQRRITNQEQLEEILTDRVGQTSSDEILAALEAEKVSCARVNTISEAFRCRQVTELDQELACGRDQEVRVVGSPFHLGLVEPAKTSAPPALGADTEEIRATRDW
jgi:crotonobetainyl-CoA:carnitine CoA-transferase CaiB-like acyl-CoA transferase